MADASYEAQETRSAGVLAQADPEAPRSGNTPRFSTGNNPMRRSSSAGRTVRLVLKELPEHVATALAGFDLDGDGTVNLSELHQGADAGARAVSRHHFYKKLFVILFGLWLAQLGSTFGVVFGVVNYSKESIVSKSTAQMLTKDQTQVVQTAAAMINVPLSSTLSDDAFMELKRIGLVSPTGATMHLTVLGFVRLPGSLGSGSDQVIFVTHIGRIVLQGTDLSYFDDTTAALFEAAGFSVNGVTRRLLQVRALFGIFNAVASVTAEGTTAPAGVPPPSLPDNFKMFARRLTPCVPFTPSNGAAVPLYNGIYDPATPLPRAQGVDLCSLLQINDTSLLHTYNDDGSVDQRFVAMSYTMYRLGSTLLRVEYEHPLVPGQMLVEVVDATDAAAPVQFEYQVSSSDKGIGLLPSSSSAQPVLLGPVAYYNVTAVTAKDLIAESMSAPMDYLGTTSLAGEDVRIWALHLHNNTFHAYWYDSVASQTVRRIAFGDFGALDVISIEPLDGDGDMASNAHLFMQPEIGITDIGNATDGSLTPLPARVTLDPFVPYQEAYKIEYGAASAGRRRRLQQAAAELAAAERSASARRTLLANAAAALVTEPAQFASLSINNSAGGRSLLQSSSLGCASNNKCPIKPTLFPGGGGYQNQAVVFAVPACPLGFVVGPVNRAPCMYEISVSVSPTQVAVPLPLVITGALGVSLCNDLSSYDQIYANLALAIGVPGIPAGSPLELFSWQIASVQLSQNNDVQELQCSVDGNGNLIIPDPGDQALLGGLISRLGVSGARSACSCLANTQFRNGLGFLVGGPDIPGFALLAVPVLNTAIVAAGVTPFLVFVKMRPSIGWSYYPYYCGLTRNDIDFVITLSLDLVFFKDSVNLFDPSFNFLNSYYPQGQVGMELPSFTDIPTGIVNQAQEIIDYIGKKIAQNTIDWAAIVSFSADLKDAATKYFNSAAGQANSALTRIFKPSRIYEYGCFQSYWTGGQCTARTKKVKIFGRTVGGICYMWAPYELHCGSTQRCIANCR